MIFSHILGAGSRSLENKRITVLLHIFPDGVMWGGALGSVVVEKPDPNPISLAAWTWLGPPDRGDYVFYGTINKPGVRRIELTEDDGAVSEAEVRSGQKAYFIPRPRQGDWWPVQSPAVLRVDNCECHLMHARII